MMVKTSTHHSRGSTLIEMLHVEVHIVIGEGEKLLDPPIWKRSDNIKVGVYLWGAT